MRPNTLLSSLCTALVGFASVSGHAQDSGSAERARMEWELELGIGAEYDSNVSVTEVDTSSGEGDRAGVLEAGVRGRRRIGEQSELTLNYDFSSTIYEEFGDVDRQTHLAGAMFTHNHGPVTLGVSGYLIHSRLDGNAFLDYRRLSPSISGFVAKKWFLRGALVTSERDISNRDERDADSEVVEADVYYFWRGLRSYFNVGYRWREENAVAGEFDFESHGFKVRYIQRVEVLGRQGKLELSWRWEDRDYGEPTPEIDALRQDERSRWKLDFTAPVTDQLRLEFYTSYGNYQSNLPRVDFTQSVTGFRAVLAL